MAARVVNEEGNRVLYFQGRTNNLNVREEDALLAFDVARRIAEHEGVELVVWATEPNELVEDPEELADLKRYSGRGNRALSSIDAGDLVVVPAHVANDAPGTRRSFDLGGRDQMKGEL